MKKQICFYIDPTVITFTEVKYKKVVMYHEGGGEVKLIEGFTLEQVISIGEEVGLWEMVDGDLQDSGSEYSDVWYKFNRLLGILT